MVWLDLDAKPALNTGTPSVEAHWGGVYQTHQKENLILKQKVSNYGQMIDHYIRSSISLQPLRSHFYMILKLFQILPVTGNLPITTDISKNDSFPRQMLDHCL